MTTPTQKQSEMPDDIWAWQCEDPDFNGWQLTDGYDETAYVRYVRADLVTRAQPSETPVAGKVREYIAADGQKTMSLAARDDLIAILEQQAAPDEFGSDKSRLSAARDVIRNHEYALADLAAKVDALKNDPMIFLYGASERHAHKVACNAVLALIRKVA